MHVAPEPAPGARDARFPLVLLGVYALLWLALAIRPLFRQDWLLENLLVFVTLPLVLLAWRRGVLSRLSCAMLFAFYVLHAVGAHYTYALVPYETWARALTGHGIGEVLGWQRNHYDRLIHFAYGLLVYRPYVEVARGPLRLAPRLAAAAAIIVILASSSLYELLEWAAAVLFGGDLGVAYLGTQGDVWDAQKDMLLALAGALFAGVCSFTVSSKTAALA